MPHDIDMIDDEFLFPRSEFYSRFEGTTAFLDQKHFNSYHRSIRTRFYAQAGGKRRAHIDSPCANKNVPMTSFYSRSGGYSSPFSLDSYSELITLQEQAPESNVNVRDALIDYKRRMAEVVVSSFEAGTNNQQSILKKHCRNRYHTRPVVYYENNYPCVVVNLPIINADKGWKKNPKPIQKLIMACFVATLNIEAYKAGIPIEMVMRASFGHNLPSVSETGNSFRINVGLIPKQYAELIGKSLSKLNQVISELSTNASNFEIDATLNADIRKYNAQKLKKIIDEKDRYESLRGNRNYKKAGNSDKAFKELYAEYKQLNANAISKKGGSTFVAVNLQGKIWDILKQAGDSKGRPLLAELFRSHDTVEWFTDRLMDALLANKATPVESALGDLLGCIKYKDTVTMNYPKIKQGLKRAKRKFHDVSFQHLYQEDEEFKKIIELIFHALVAESPESNLYAELDCANTNFFTTYRGNSELDDESDFGSDSEFSYDFSEDEQCLSEDFYFQAERSDDDIFGEENNNVHLSHQKLRVCSGMKAIMIAQYAAVAHLRESGAREFGRDVELMYYEVEQALQLVKDTDIKLNKVRAKKYSNYILHYDLNHCNALNSPTKASLSAKLKSTQASIAILDYTSATLDEVYTAAKTCLKKDGIEFVIMVDSGLKNNQGGADINPYGEVRVMARDSVARDWLIEKMKAGLSKADKLPAKSHEMVRASKRRGLAVSLLGFFRNQRKRNNEKADSNLTTPARPHRAQYILTVLGVRLMSFKTFIKLMLAGVAFPIIFLPLAYTLFYFYESSLVQANPLQFLPMYIPILFGLANVIHHWVGDRCPVDNLDWRLWITGGILGFLVAVLGVFVFDVPTLLFGLSHGLQYLPLVFLPIVYGAIFCYIIKWLNLVLDV